MKKKEALEVALLGIHDLHGCITGDEHDVKVLECDCRYGKAVRKLIRTVGKNHYDEHVQMLREAPTAPIIPMKKKRTPRPTAVPQQDRELVGVH
jgi:hypothetical protein